MRLLLAVVDAALIVSATRLHVHSHIGANKSSLEHTGKALAGNPTSYGEREQEVFLEHVVNKFNNNIFGNFTPYPYNFQGRWEGLNFDAKWEMFQREVPLENLQGYYDRETDVGPVCWPTLVGEKDSKKLAILMHGFLSCPGMWYRVVRRLLDEGFRVMMPTLPGHGRNYRYANPEKAIDDLRFMPRDAQAYLAFADAVQELAVQFKKEHPDGVVVAAGHSLGGAITAKYAMEIPDVVDRVLLLNPMLSLRLSFVNDVARLSPGTRIQKPGSCESKRGSGSGGMCQFQLVHVTAMEDFAYATLCCHWGFTGVCNARKNSFLSIYTDALKSLLMPALGADPMQHFRRIYGDAQCTKLRWSEKAMNTRRGFADIKSFQVVTTESEWLVDNMVTSSLVGNVRWRRGLREPRGSFTKEGLDFCYWPSDLGHSYISNRNRPGETEKWWHPYVENAIEEFLLSGKAIDVVERKSDGTNSCLTSSDDVAGGALARLPAMQTETTYWIGRKDHPWHTPAHVMYEGSAIKQSKWLGNYHERNIELLRFAKSILLVTRMLKHANVRDLFVVRKMPVTVVANDFSGKAEFNDTSLADAKCCAKINLDSISADRPLIPQVGTVEGNTNKPQVLTFCGTKFIGILCRHYGCTAEDGAGNKVTVTPPTLQTKCGEDFSTASDFEIGV